MLADEEYSPETCCTEAADGSAGAPRLRHGGWVGAVAREGPGAEEEEENGGRRLQLDASPAGSAASLALSSLS
ncbi:hypothetical protein E2320_012311 [Naja naja]|nr:hypothetical protein E2320_012311 [Naja naja]